MVYGIVIYYVLLYIGVQVYENRECVVRWSKSTYRKVVDWIHEIIPSIRRSMSEIWDKYGTGAYFRKAMKFVCYIGIISWLIWSFETNWWTWYVGHISSYVNIPTALANLLLGGYVLGLLLSLALHHYYKRPLRWREHVYSALTIGILHVWFRLCSSKFTFTPLSFIDSPIGYIDVVLILYVLYVGARIYQERAHKEYNSQLFPATQDYYLYDAPVQDRAGDTLEFGTLAKLVEEKIETLTREHSWSIGIVGPWGSGKTSYIHLILSNLPAEKYMVVQFNPRYASRPSKIQEMALNTLSEAIEPYNSGIRLLMRRYITALQLDGANGWIQVILSLIKHTYSLSDIREELDKVLANLPKQVIFVFDDFDRLTKTELVEVLKLIDGNANFKNVIYLAAYDRAHVGELLRSQTYIEKYFSIEIHVPFSSEGDVINYLNEQLHLMIPQVNKQDKLAVSITDVIGNHRKRFKQVIRTMRDAKRFVNMLKTDVLTIYSRDLDMEDFLLLELLKFHNTHLYETLYEMPTTYLNDSSYFSVKKEVATSKKIEDIEKELLAAMFPKDISYSDRPNRIRKPEMFAQYFVREEKERERVKLYDLFDELITEKQVRGMLESISTRPDDINELFESIDKYGKMYVDSVESFKRYIYIILCANSVLGDRYVVPDTWEIFKASFGAEFAERTQRPIPPDMSEVRIMKYYTENNWTQGDVSILSGVVPELYYETKIREYAIHKQRMAPIIRGKFEQMSAAYMAKPEENDFNLLIRVFYLCIDHIEPSTNRLVIDAGCCKKMREVIEKAPAAYVDSFVRLGGMSSAADVNSIACEPFWKQIFGTQPEFETFLRGLEAEMYPRMTRVWNFWRIYKANQYEIVEFRHQGNVQQIIESDLVEQARQLDELKEWDVKARVIPKIEETDKRKQMAEEMLVKISQIPLNVIYKKRVYDRVKRMLDEVRMMRGE